MRALATGLILAAGLLACAGDPAAPPEGLRSLRLEGRLLAPDGAPIAGGRVVFFPWFSAGLKAQPAYPLPYSSNDWAVSGPDGRFVLSVPGLPGVAIDSVVLTTYGPGCLPEASWTTIVADDLPSGPDGVLTLDLMGAEVPAPAVTAVGQVCAAGDHHEWGALDIHLAVKIDSLRGELVYGKWVVNYRHSSVGPDGTFQGVQGDGVLVLSLLPGALSSSYCTELRLAIPIGAGGTWGKAGVLYDDGCLPEGMDLVFTPVPAGWFFP